MMGTGPGRARGRGRQRGFTLLEVMMALAILAVALVGLIGRTTANIRISQETAMLGVVTELARGKMYDIEEDLLRDGFQETDQSSDGDFDDEGWSDIRWEADVQKIELPNQEALKSLEEGGEGGEAELAGDLARGETPEAGGMLGGMMGMLGGGEGDDGGMTGAFISAQYEIFRQVLEAAIRKVTLTVTWKVGNEDKEMVVACYFTDPSAISRVLPGIGNLGGGGGGGIGGEVGGGRGGGSAGRGGDTK